MKTNMEYFDFEGMPTLMIKTGDKKIGTGYLHPFRAYSFQVSGTADGCGDCGSTSVMDLPSLAKNITKENAIIVLRELAQIAVANFMKSTPQQAAIECGRFENFGQFDQWLEAVYVGLTRPECRFGHWS